MLHNVFLKTLRDQRRAILWWGIGLIILALVVIAYYPSIKGIPEFNTMVEQMPEGLRRLFMGQFSDILSPQGYLNTQLFFFMVPLLFLVYAIGLGADALAGEEERKTIDLLLSTPLPRWRVVVEKFAALLVLVSALAFSLWLGLAIGAAMVDMAISYGRLADITISGALLGLAFGAFALAVGCSTGRRGVAMGVAGIIAVATYFLNTLGPLTDILKPYQGLSPFYYYIEADPLVNGLNMGHAIVLMGLTIVCLIIALVAFERRDLAV